MKIPGVYLSCNKNLEQDKNFYERTANIENNLKLWGMRQLTLEGRIIVFKSLADSKLIHLLLITKLHKLLLIFCIKYKKNFIWKWK